MSHSSSVACSRRRHRTAKPGLHAALVGLLTVLISPAPGSAQDSESIVEIGVAPTFTTALAGDAWDGFDDSFGVSATTAVHPGRSWRLAAVGSYSSHRATSDLGTEAELLSLVGEVRRSFQLPARGLTTYVGGRGGVVHQEFDTAILAVIEVDLLPGTSVVDRDTGPLFGPVAGVRVPVAGPFTVDVGAVYYWADVSPLLVGPSEDPGLSRAASVTLSLSAGF